MLKLTHYYLLLAVSTLYLTACSVFEVDDVSATNEARVTATPKANPQRTITNLTCNLQCKDELFISYNISDLLVGAQVVVEPNTKARVATKDMLNSVRPLDLTLNTNRGTSPILRAGELLSIRVSVTTDAYVYCYYRQADGKVLKLFPNRYVPNPRLKTDEELFIPGGHFKLIPGYANSQEQVMCIASYNNIDNNLPTELKVRDLQLIPVANLSSVFQYYKKVSTIAPLQKTITIKVR